MQRVTLRTSQGLSALQPLPRGAFRERDQEASLINELTGLGRSVTARLRPVAEGAPQPSHVFRRAFPLVQPEEMQTAAGAEEEALRLLGAEGQGAWASVSWSVKTWRSKW